MASDEAPPPAGGRAKGGRIILLGVEDPRLERDVRGALCDRYLVEEASTPAGLLDAARDLSPDLIVLKELRGGGSSPDVLLDLQCEPSTRDIPVLLLAEEDELDPEWELPEGVVDLLVLPLRRHELELRAAALLKARGRHPSGPGPPAARVQKPAAAEQRLRRHNRVLVRLAKSRSASRGDLDEALREITCAAARTLEVERASIWFFSDDREWISCADLYELSLGAHSSGMVLSRASHPIYLRALTRERVLVAHDARSDVRTREFLRTYLTPLAIASMLDAPIRLRGRMVGVTCHEHVGPPRRWAADEQAFAASLGDLVALALQARERREVEDALRASESKYRSMVEHIPAVTYLTPALPLYHRMHSPQLDRILGFPPERGKDDPRLWADHLHPPDRERVISELSRSQSERRPFRCEYRMTTCEGKLIWIRDEGNWLMDERAGFHLQGVMVDITDRKLAEDALKEADRRKDRFLATLAHELRNPLAPIYNAVELFQLHRLEDPTLAWARDVLARQVRHLTRLVDDLLDVSRITLGKVKLHREPVMVSDAVARAIDTSGPAIQAGGHRLEVALPPEPLWVLGDQDRLAQVLLNLLNNAAKYMRKGGRIWISVKRECGEAVLRVRDEGMGIPPTMLPRIFEPFMQLDSSLDRAQGGLGIGLTLVRSLVGMHGGTVQAFSEGPDRGSEFVVRLPALDRRDPRPSGAGRMPAAAPSAVRNILVVDDNRDAASSLALLLGGMGGYEVQTALDGRSALEAVQTFHPDLVFLDIGLPGLDGYQVARRIRAMEAGRPLVLVALTGYGQGEDLRKAREAGMDQHILKPLYPERLKEILESLPPPSKPLPGGPPPAGPCAPAGV